MANISDKKRTIISDEGEEIIEGMVGKYSLAESDAEYLRKVKNKQTPNEVLIVDIVRQLAQNIITDKKAVSAFQKEAGLSADKAGDLVKELKTHVLPLVEIVSEADIEKSLQKEKAQIPAPVKAPVAKPAPKPAAGPQKDLYSEEIEIKKPVIAKPVLEDITKKEKILPPPVARPQQPKKDDVYREPLS